ncbi:MAG: hypothetical protein UH963_01400 [Agathobacter sp.]|nr:hypothetical protein [Agathobacter sp.]
MNGGNGMWSFGKIVCAIKKQKPEKEGWRKRRLEYVNKSSECNKNIR